MLGPGFGAERFCCVFICGFVLSDLRCCDCLGNRIVWCLLVSWTVGDLLFYLWFDVEFCDFGSW